MARIPWTCGVRMMAWVQLAWEKGVVAFLTYNLSWCAWIWREAGVQGCAGLVMSESVSSMVLVEARLHGEEDHAILPCT